MIRGMSRLDVFFDSGGGREEYIEAQFVATDVEEKD